MTYGRQLFVGVSAFLLGVVVTVLVRRVDWLDRGHAPSHMVEPDRTATPAGDGVSTLKRGIPARAETVTADAYSPASDGPAILQPPESPDRGAVNYWGMISDDGRRFQSSRAAVALSQDDRYRAIFVHLSAHDDPLNRASVENAIQTAIDAEGGHAGIFEIACDQTICVGSLTVSSEVLADRVLRRIYADKSSNGVSRVMMDMDVTATGLGRFVVVTDPKVRSSTLSVAPDYRMTATRQITPDARRALEETLRKSMTNQK